MSKKTKVYSIRIDGVLYQKRATPSQGRRWLTDMEEKREAGIPIEVGNANSTFTAVASKWYEDRAKSSKPKASHRPEWQRLNDFIFPRVGAKKRVDVVNGKEVETWIGGKKIQAISASDWETIFKTITDPNKDPKARNTGKVSPATCNRIRAMISKIYNDTRKKIPQLPNPIRDVEPNDEGDVEAKSNPPTIDQMQAYLAAARIVSLQSVHNNLSFYVSSMMKANGGPRDGETKGFLWKDWLRDIQILRLTKILDRSTGRIVERTKGKRGKNKGRRDIGINDMLESALTEHFNATPYNKPNDPIVHRKDGRPFSPRSEYDLHLMTLEKAGLDHFRGHDIRHFFAGEYRAAGGSRDDLQDQLGHGSPKMTERYEKFAPEYHQKRAQLVRIGPKNSEHQRQSVTVCNGESDDKIDDNATKSKRKRD